MTKQHKLVILGDSAFAEIAYEYFTYDSPYEVVAFSVDREFMKRESLFDRPIIPFDELLNRYPPQDYVVFTAFVYTQLNRLRTRFYHEAKSKGYQFASYISPHAFVWRNVHVGENCFIFENNVIQPFVKIGNNVVLWSGNHIGHHTVIRDHCFIASHVVVSGFCDIGESCFIGVNATFANNVTVGRDCLIGAGAAILRDVSEGGIFATKMTEVRAKTTWDHFGISREN